MGVLGRGRGREAGRSGWVGDVLCDGGDGACSGRGWGVRGRRALPVSGWYSLVRGGAVAGRRSSSGPPAWSDGSPGEPLVLIHARLWDLGTTSDTSTLDVKPSGLQMFSDH